MRSVDNILENKELELTSVDPELDRLYREHAIAVGLTAMQPTQVPNHPELDKETDHDQDPIEECSSTFSGL